MPDPFLDQRRRGEEDAGLQAFGDRLFDAGVDRSVERPQLPRLDLRAQELGRSIERAEGIADRRRRMKRNRHAADVHQLERSHADAKRPLGDLVDRDRVGHPFFEHPDRFHEPHDEEPVDDEAAGVGGSDRNLAELLLQHPRALDDVAVARRAGDDLDEPVFRRVEEVVQADARDRDVVAADAISLTR